jgi:tight adherence protein C
MLAVAVTTGVVAVMLFVIAVALPRTSGERVLSTLSLFGVSGRGDDPTGPVAPTPGDRLRLLTRRTSGRIGRLLTPAGTRRRLIRLLERAGNPPGWPVDRVIRSRALSLIAVTLFLAAVAQSLAGGTAALPAAVAGLVLGQFLPDLLIHNAAVKRQDQLARSLPDVLDALVIGVEAGLGLDAAMAQVARNLHGPMADEIHRVLQEMKIGVARTDALQALSARTTVRELKNLVTALVQSAELGVPVAAVLREHAREQRLKRRQRAEELAQKVPVKLLFPVLFCLFPVVFIVILGPAVLRMMASFAF